VSFEVAGKSAVAADPGKGALDDPTLGQNDEAVKITALDDLEFPGAGLGDGTRRLVALIAAIGEDALDEREQASRPPQQWDGRVAILDIAGRDEDVQ